MRVAAIRDDIGSVYLADLRPNHQRSFTQSAPGQARYISKPTDAELAAIIASSGVVAAVVGSNTSATVDTSANNTLRIKASASAAFTVIVVTAGATTAKSVIASDLNTAFATAGLPLFADVLGTNALRIKSTVAGPSSYLALDSTGNGSTLNTAVGFSNIVTTGVSVTELKTAVYPTATTVNVSSATISALGDISLLDPSQQASIVAAIADLVAPELVETGYAQLSFYRGVMKSLRSASFKPGGNRVGLPAGPAIAVVENNGSTPF